METTELKQLCVALNIDIGEKKPQIEPVELPKTPAIPVKDKFARDDLFPDAILSYSGSTPYLILVEKSSHTLFLLKYDKGKQTVVESFDCKTGRNNGDKKEHGDEKTPEGIYFLINKYSRKEIQRLVGKDNAYQYGEIAFVTNFPNAIDIQKGKNGSGIWLHGTDEPFEKTSSNDTRGCVVTTNESIVKLSKYIEPGKTPIIILDTVNFKSRDEMNKQSKTAMELIQDWKTAWENKKIDGYIKHYASSFSSQGMTRNQWKIDKQGKFERNNEYNIDLKDIIILAHNGNIVVQFVQNYSIKNTNFSTVGTKTLYLVPEQNTWKIVAEQFR
ncbi:L,D-transpeptidase family protein [bacterium]|nr:L,D-transpeptidase family protein [bacterium]